MDRNKTPAEVKSFLESNSLDLETSKLLFDENVDGAAFFEITESDLKELGVKLGSRKRILRLIQAAKDNENAIEEARMKAPSLENYLLDCSRSTASSSLTEESSRSYEFTPISQYSEPNVDDPIHYPSEVLILECSRSPPSSSIPDEPSRSYDYAPTSQYSDPDEINVTRMLLQNERGRNIAEKLKKGEIISKAECSEIVRIAVNSMVQDLKTLYPTTSQKLNLAKAMVRDFPLLRLERTNLEGYEHLFNPESRQGAIEWRVKTMRLALPPSKKKNKCRKRKLGYKERERNPVADNNIDEADYYTLYEDMKDKINWLKFQISTELYRSEIFETMKATFRVRRLFVGRAPSVTAILEEYPKLKDYGGALIDAEFQQLYPKADSLLEYFPSFYSKRLQLYTQNMRFDIVKRIGEVHDVNLCSLLYLADLLPVTGFKKRTLDDDRSNFPSEALITFAGVDSSIEDIVNRRRCRQPYLITTDKQDKEKIFFLILDKMFIDVGSCPIKAFDILYKCHYVFNIQFEQQLALFFNFMDHIIYKIFNGSARSAAENLNNLLKSVKC